MPRADSAVPVSAFRLAAGGREASLRLDRGVSLSREAFDAALIRRAIADGVEFLPATRATGVVPRTGEAVRRVLLHQQGGEREIAASIILAADGLGAIP